MTPWKSKSKMITDTLLLIIFIVECLKKLLNCSLKCSYSLSITLLTVCLVFDYMLFNSDFVKTDKVKITCFLIVILWKQTKLSRKVWPISAIHIYCSCEWIRRIGTDHLWLLIYVYVFLIWKNTTLIPWFLQIYIPNGMVAENVFVKKTYR